MQANILLAKSAHYGATPLKDHLRQVAEAAQCFAKNFGLNEQLAYHGGLLHDIGKAHPTFQERLRESSISLYDRLKRKTFRHEIASLAFLPLFPQEHWPFLTEMVIAHHKKIEGDPGEKGVLDLDKKSAQYVKNHLEPWAEWSPPALEVLAELGVQTRDISLAEAESALALAVEFCEGLPCDWSRWRGVLMAADHFVSAMGAAAVDRLPRLFAPPDVKVFDMPHHLFPLSNMAADDQRPHTLLVAPTGAGKTEFLLRRCRGRIFYTLPFQASINAMHVRLKAALGADADVRMLHASSRLIDAKQEDIALQPFVGASVKVLTPHQLAGAVFATGGFEALLLDLRGSDVILDEIHTYGGVSQALTLELVRLLARLDCRVHIGTATMPTALYRHLLELLGEHNTQEVRLPAETLQNYDRHIVHKIQEEDVDALVRKARDNGEKLLVVCNTVKRAQEVFERLESKFAAAMLLHSRFRRCDRATKETDLKEQFDQRAQVPCLVVATQVVEVSLDISFDRMITDAAPLDALIQRFGRVNRRRTEETIGKHKPVHVLHPGEKALPYEKAEVEASFAALPDGEVLRTAELQALLDRVYPDLQVLPIESHIRWRYGPDGSLKFKDKMLTHVSKSVLLELMEIDTGVCILADDVEPYQKAKDWATRQKLEIPVHARSLFAVRDKWARLEEGSAPFVAPQSVADHLKYGLKFDATNDFIL